MAQLQGNPGHGRQCWTEEEEGQDVSLLSFPKVTQVVTEVTVVHTKWTTFTLKKSRQSEVAPIQISPEGRLSNRGEGRGRSTQSGNAESGLHVKQQELWMEVTILRCSKGTDKFSMHTNRKRWFTTHVIILRMLQGYRNTYVACPPWPPLLD